MVEIDDNRLKGNYAANLVSHWLSRSCLVRPVAEGTDIGIDLYCESVIDNSPFLHFWVQSKTINSSNISTDGKSAWYDFQTKHLEYWGRQPVPVYAFLVPIQVASRLPSRIFYIPITQHILKNGIPKQTYQRIEAHYQIEIDKIDNDLRELLTFSVPYDSATLLLQKGIIVPEPTRRQSGMPVDILPVGIAAMYLDKIIRATKLTFRQLPMEIGMKRSELQRFNFQQLLADLDTITEEIDEVKKC